MHRISRRATTCYKQRVQRKVQQVEETEGSSADGSDPQLVLENRVSMLLRRVRGNAAEELQDALDSEERRARRARHRSETR